ncbi:MAG: hypothetical protein ACYT04_01305 [Nostoc sp.]
MQKDFPELIFCHSTPALYASCSTEFSSQQQILTIQPEINRQFQGDTSD